MAENETNQENHGLQENRVFPPPAGFVANAAISGMEGYNKLCAEAEADYEEIGRASCRERV